jgi:hypothetical protein
MVFLGSLAGSNTVSVDDLTTTGLVTTPQLRLGPVTTVQEALNRFYFGYQSSITVTDTGPTLVTVTVSGTSGGERIFVTPVYTGAAVPSLYVRVYDQTAGSFRVTLRLDDETPGTRTCAFYWVVLD